MDGWDNTPEWEVPDNYDPKTKVSVIIAARNEEKHIGKCLESILNNTYPKDFFEVIIVNDHSEDATEQKVNIFQNSNITLLKLTEVSGKKHALQKGIEKASGTLILCTDADSIVPENWLMSFVSFFETNDPKCMAAPIVYQSDNSVLQRFQYLDALNNMCVAANGIKKKSYYMANGANLSFRKSTFEEVDGYTKNLSLASGDDMFLIQEIANKYPLDVSYIKSKQATVETLAETTFEGLKNQRTRWATKSKSYANKNIVRIQGFVFCFVFLILLNLILSPFGCGLSLFGFLLALFIKWTIDYLYLSKLSDYFDNRAPLKSFFGVSLGFMVYILFAGWKALRPTKYMWKGRETN